MHISHEIIVIDNASVDGSVAMVRREFPGVILQVNERNTGFAAANNIGLSRAKGRYFVLINPDTIVREDTFSRLIKFMDTHSDAGAATCKILNPDGSFSIDARHSIPTPLTALWKLLGLNRLFPRSKIFGRYNMTYLDPDETNIVDAISGSFMMIRRAAYETTGPLDEDYFMFCEDIDYCYRITQHNWKIYYVPETSIIHYKGESTKKDNLDYVINFNKSLYLFYKKHFHQNYVSMFRWVILTGVMVRGVMVYLKTLIKSNISMLLDLIILNSAYFISFGIRYGIDRPGFLSDFIHQYIFINLIASLVYLVSSLFLELYTRFKFSLAQVLKVNILTTVIVAALTFFVRQLAFSRIVILISALFCILFMIAWRVTIRWLSANRKNVFSMQLFQKRLVLVGSGKESSRLIDILRNPLTFGYEIRGIISPYDDEIGKTIKEVPVVSGLDNLHEYIRLEKINQVIFLSHSTGYEMIFRTMSRIDNPRIDFKIVPEKLHAMIGKSSVEEFADISLLNIDLAIGQGFNRFNKRLFDIILSLTVLVLGAPLWILGLVSGFGGGYTMEISDKRGKPLRIKRSTNKRTDQVFILLNILCGKLSFVGAALHPPGNTEPAYTYKPGITGLVQINRNKINSAHEAEMYDLYYLKNQNFWLDLEILSKALFASKGS